MPYKNRRTHPNAQKVNRRGRLKQEYGITLEDYDNMFLEQDGVCAICHLPEDDSYKRHLCIDHDHETGRIRGLLCFNCNTGLGRFKDSVEVCESAIEYLKKDYTDSFIVPLKKNKERQEMASMIEYLQQQLFEQ